MAILLAAADVMFAQQPGMMPGMMPQQGMQRARGNNAQKQQQQQMQRTPVQTSGTIEGISSGVMSVDANGQKMLVAADKNCKVEVTGTADPSFLKAGLMVRFTADFDKKGKATVPVAELEIVTPQNAMVTEHGRGVGPTAAESAKSGGLAANLGTQSGPVVGAIKEAKNNTITVVTGSGTVTADIAPTASIKVNVNDARFAQVGDKIELRGYSTQPPKVIAEDVRITLSKPLGDSSAKPKPAAKTADKAASTAAAN